MNEFDWIETYLKPLAGPEGLGLLDDAALFKPRQGQDLVLTKDTLVEGVHFFKGEYGAGTAERLMVVNLSDLAAKGARPLGYLLSIAWPKHLDEANLKQWMQGFAKGLGAQQDAFGFKLFGGDTVRTSGPMTVSATFIGTVPEGEMVKRSAAHIGDDIWVTGTIGDAHLGLLLAQKSEQITEPDGQAIGPGKKHSATPSQDSFLERCSDNMRRLAPIYQTAFCQKRVTSQKQVERNSLLI